jgi:hypothetical protein
MIELIRLLRRVGLAHEPRDIADVVWLAQHLPPTVEMLEEPGIPQSLTEPAGTTASLEHSDEPPVQSSSPNRPKASAPPKVDPEGLYASAGREHGTGLPAGRVRVPGATALPGSLEIARALRPFSRRIASRWRKTLDVEATVRWIADGGPVTAVLRPLPERWFDVALVVEETTAMALWDRTIAELYRLLQRHGAFRDVRRWTLRIEDGVLKLQEGRLAASLHALRDPLGRRLVLLVSDFVSPGWYDGTMAAAIGSWAETTPVTVLQVLPRRLWQRTALGEADLHLRAKYAGCRNQDLSVEKPLWRSDEPAGLPLPVAPLDAPSIAAWARMLMMPGVSAPGVVLDAPEDGEGEEAVDTPDFGVASPTERVQRFRAMASPAAFDLAVCLSAVPLTLPVMRLVQRTVRPESRQAHLAEVLLGGLIERITPPDTSDSTCPIDEVEFEFLAGVRGLLHGSLRRDETFAIWGQVARHIENKTGVAVDFQALAGLTDGTQAIPEAALPFARVARQVLERLGMPPRMAPVEPGAAPLFDRPQHPDDEADALPATQTDEQVILEEREDQFSPGADDWALVVGIDWYARLPHVAGAVDAARKFHDWLVSSEGGTIRKDHMVLLTSEQEGQDQGAGVTAQVVNAQLSALLARAAEPEAQASGTESAHRRLYIYLGGRGELVGREVTDVVLLTADATSEIDSRIIAPTVFAESAVRSGAFGEVVLVADLTDPTLRTSLQVKPDLPLSTPTPEPVRFFHAIATSTRQIEDRQPPVGVFTQTLLKGLRGWAGNDEGHVYTGALERYMRAETARGAPFRYAIRSSNAFVLTRVARPWVRVRVSVSPVFAGLRARLHSPRFGEVAVGMLQENHWEAIVPPGPYTVSLVGARKALAIAATPEERSVGLRWVRRAEAVLVAGTGDDSLSELEASIAFALGEGLAMAGFGLVTGGPSGVDEMAVTGFLYRLRSGELPEKLWPHLRQVLIPDQRRTTAYGEVAHAPPGTAWLDIALSGVAAVVLLGGTGETHRVFQAAASKGVPVIPIPVAGGDAAEVFATLLNEQGARMADGVSFGDLDRSVGSPDDARELVEVVLRLLLTQGDLRGDHRDSAFDETLQDDHLKVTMHHYDPPVLVAEIPKAGNRWQQGNFTRAVFERFFGVEVGRRSHVPLQHVGPDGALAPVRERPSVQVRSQNYRFELAGAPRGPYPDSGPPITVFLKSPDGTFLYRVLMPFDAQYGAADWFLAERWNGPARERRRVITTASELRRVWPEAPFWRIE